MATRYALAVGSGTESSSHPHKTESDFSTSEGNYASVSRVCFSSDHTLQKCPLIQKPKDIQAKRDENLGDEYQACPWARVERSGPPLSILSTKSLESKSWREEKGQKETQITSQKYTWNNKNDDLLWPRRLSRYCTEAALGGLNFYVVYGWR